MNRHCTVLLTLALAGGVATPANAAAVHKWVDADGVTHYADKPPDSVETTLVDLPEPPAAQTASEDGRLVDDYYSISNQWQRINRERIERERLNLERARIRAAQQTPAPPAAADEAADIRYVPVYSGFRFHRPHRYHGGMRPRPRPMPAPSLGTFPTQ